MDIERLKKTARAMVAPGQGILAMDESTPTCGKRLEAVGVENTEENRVAYRSLLLGTPGLGEFISGAILYDETIRQNNVDGVPFTDVLKDQDILIGIKVDAGAKDLALHPGEKVTEGLDGLRDRLAEYNAMGASFCKWRAVITIGEDRPSTAALQANAHALARYAAHCQEAGLVPIVEPEVLLDGAHTIETSYEVTLATQRAVFEALFKQGVIYEGMILKPSMVISGKDCPQRADAQRVADETIRCLSNAVPASVPGIAFLSGGQSDEEATLHLNIMNNIAKNRHDLPWRLTFSYARALQQVALSTWRGDPNALEEAQQALLHRARLNSMASRGDYTQQMEQQRAA